MTLYRTGVAWKELKEKHPQRLESPMRVVLMQALLTTVASRFEQLMATEASRTEAAKIGWLTKDATKVNVMKWSAESKCHEVDPDGVPLPTEEVTKGLMDLIVLAKTPLVINRFHATRPLAQEYESQVLPMMLDVGLRLKEADKMWEILRSMSRSAIWVAAGLYMRPDRLQRGALAQRIAAMMGQTTP